MPLKVGVASLVMLSALLEPESLASPRSGWLGGAGGGMGSKVQLVMSCVAVDPPVAPVNPTNADDPPSSVGRSMTSVLVSLLDPCTSSAAITPPLYVSVTMIGVLLRLVSMLLWV